MMPVEICMPLASAAPLASVTPIAPRTHLQLHGYPTLLLAGRRAALKLKHALALLAVLSRARGPLGRAHLASLLWSDGRADTLRARLRRLAHQTRQAAQAALFAGDADSLALRTGWTSDLQCTQAAMSRLNAALDGAAGASHGAADEAAMLAALAQPLLAPEAAGLLEGFTLGTEAFDAWVDQERRSHVAALTRVLERLAARALEREASDLAEQTAWALLRLDACNESAHRARLGARAARGDAAGVETAYFDGARTLREELGIGPSPALEAAYTRARATLEHAARSPQRLAA